MVEINRIRIEPPIINTSCAWASELAQLEELYNSSYIGAVTTRTATMGGFVEDSSHAVCDLAHLWRSVLTCSRLGGLWEHIGIDPELVWLLTSPTVQLHRVDTRHPLSSDQYQTVHHKHHVELPQRTSTNG